MISFALSTSTYFEIANYAFFPLLLMVVVFIKSLGQQVSYLVTTNPEIKITIFQMLWIFMISFFSPHPGEAFMGALHIINITFIAFIACIFLRNEEDYKHILAAIVIGCFIGQIMNFRSVSSLSFDARNIDDNILSINSYAHNVTIGFLAAALLFMFYKSTWIKISLLVFMGMSSVSFMMVGSRQSLIVLICFFVIVNLVKNARSNVASILTLLAYFIVGVLVAVFIYSSFQDSILLKRFTETNVTEDSRYEILQNAWNLFQKRPILGYGVATYRFYDRYVYTHNTTAELLFTGGVVYFALYYLMFLRFLKSIWRYLSVNRKLFGNLFAILLVFVIGGQFFLFHTSRLALILIFSSSFYFRGYLLDYQYRNYTSNLS